ncbi:MAG: deferrochelatase/peroxidase EfeB [Solirubrobacteraceae bacterium]|nr:deferrochelatase/peroxidase EfeB [Solirubrobacteraceae bacterium]
MTEPAAHGDAEPAAPAAGLTRRSLLRTGAAAGVGAALGASVAVAADGDGGAGVSSADVVAFHGAHQAGITTPQQDRLVFAAFDLISDERADLEALLKAWTQAAALLTEGRAVGTVGGNPLAPPADTGEAQGLRAGRLTLTFGLGPTLFERDGTDRLGLRDRRPAALRPLPALPGDELEAERSGGDLCVQACSDDPQVAFHAVRNLTRIARQYAQLRWTQVGFGRTASTSRTQATPRNLMGFKDGTANIVGEDARAMDEHVWVGDEGDWLAGGSYLVARRISMTIESWDRAPLADQEATIGRTKVTGAPIGSAGEFDEVDLTAKGADGQLRIPANSHVAVAHPSTNGGIRILRRGYSFTDGLSADLGQLDAGLFFLAYMRDPKHFIALQRHLGSKDALNEYIRHVGSAVFAVPAGVASEGGFIGERLFA